MAKIFSRLTTLFVIIAVALMGMVGAPQSFWHSSASQTATHDWNGIEKQTHVTRFKYQPPEKDSPRGVQQWQSPGSSRLRISSSQGRKKAGMQ